MVYRRLAGAKKREAKRGQAQLNVERNRAMDKIEIGRLRGRPGSSAQRVVSTLALGSSLAGLTLASGCAVVSVASAAASIAATAASTAVDVGVGAVRVTGKVIGKGIDIVTPSSSSPAAPTASQSARN